MGVRKKARTRDPKHERRGREHGKREPKNGRKVQRKKGQAYM